MTLFAVSLTPDRTRISQPIEDAVSLSAFDGIEIPAGGAINQLRALSAIQSSEHTALLVLCDRENTDWLKRYVTDYLNVKHATFLPLLNSMPTAQTQLSPDNRFLTHRSSGQAEVTTANATSSVIRNFSQMLKYATAVMFSGDIPSGIERDIYARLSRLVSTTRARFAIDCAAEVLQENLEVQPYLVAQDQSELLKHHAIDRVGELSIDDYVELAHALINAGAQNVATALDRDGWLLVNRDGYVHLSLPKVEAVSPVGSRDAWLAITMRRHTVEGWSLEDAATSGAGAATAQLLNPIPGQFNSDDANLFAGRITHSARRFGNSLTAPQLQNAQSQSSNSQAWRSVRVFARPNQDTRFNNTLLQVSSKPKEDSFAIEANIIIVADGITHRAISGKYPSSSASANAANLICRLMPKLISLQQEDTDIEQVLRFGLKACNVAIQQINAHRSAAEIKASDLGGAVATIVLRIADKLHLLHIGDCRAMLVRNESVIELTRHQTAEVEMLAAQWKHEQVPKDEISRRKRALRNPRVHSSQTHAAFGVLTGEEQALEFAEYSTVEIDSASHLIVCSDGFGDLGTQDAIALAHDTLKPFDLARRLERFEQASSTRSDDKTIIIAEL